MGSDVDQWRYKVVGIVKNNFIPKIIMSAKFYNYLFKNGTDNKINLIPNITDYYRKKIWIILQVLERLNIVWFRLI